MHCQYCGCPLTGQRIDHVERCAFMHAQHSGGVAPFDVLTESEMLQQKAKRFTNQAIVDLALLRQMRLSQVA